MDTFADRFARAFAAARRPRDLGLVPLATLRTALGVDRPAFDAGLNELRDADVVVLHTHDGRHGTLTDDERAGALVEGGRRFVYAALR